MSAERKNPQLMKLLTNIAVNEANLTLKEYADQFKMTLVRFRINVLPQIEIMIKNLQNFQNRVEKISKPKPISAFFVE